MVRYGIMLIALFSAFFMGQANCEPCTDKDGDGFCVEDGDCDDSNASVYPGAAEVCDGIDHNCDGIACMTQG